MSSGNSPDPDDLFADTRMSFGDHIEDLRVHLWRAIAGFLVGLVISFFIGQPVLRLIAAPVEAELKRFYDRRVEKIRATLEKGDDLEVKQANMAKELEIEIDRRELAKSLNIQLPAEANGDNGENWVTLPVRVRPLKWAIATSEAERMVGKPPILSTMNITEAFMVYFKVCMVCGLVIGSPWIFWQVWSFVAVGLYPTEKKLVHVYLPVSLLLFLGGFFLCEIFVIPQAIRILLEFNEWIGLQPDLRLNEWLGFAILLPLVFGVSFQTPLIMLFLAKIGIFDVKAFRAKRKIAWFVMAVFAALITPTPDAPTMLMMWVPMCALYELGIYLALLSVDQDAETDDSETTELIEG